MSNYAPYRWCVVSECKNTSVKTPDKLWIQIPVDINMRNTWLKVARRDPELLSDKSRLYLCEDHFDLEHDMENYIKYKIMGSVKRIKMKPNCIPSRFAWNRKHKILNESHPTDAKRQRVALPEDSCHVYIKAEINEVSSYTEGLQTEMGGPSQVIKKLERKVIQINQMQEHKATQVVPSSLLKRACCNSDPPTPKDSSYDVEKEISLMDMYHKDDNLQEDEDPLYDMSYKSEPGVLDESHIKKEVPLQPELSCQVCHGDIIGFRYVCVQCADWDMCASCVARGEHPAHYVLRLPAPKPSEECEPVIAAIREHIHNLLRLSEEIKSEIESNEEIFNAEIPKELFDPHLTDPLQAAVDSCLQSSIEQNIAVVQQITTSSAPTEESPPPTVDAPRIVDNQTYSGLSDLAKECISSKTRLKIRAKRKQELKTRTEI